MAPKDSSNTPKRKSCYPCFKGKVRCDLVRPSCGRCIARGRHCSYEGARMDDAPAFSPYASAPPKVVPKVVIRQSSSMDNSYFTPINPLSNLNTREAAPTASPAREVPTSLLQNGRQASEPPLRSIAPPQNSHPQFEVRTQRTASPQSIQPKNESDLGKLDFQNVSLRPAIDEWRIRSRWIEALLPSQGETMKNLSPTVVSFSSEILKSYPRMLQESKTPPFMHKTQLVQESPALTTLISITKMWDSKRNILSPFLSDTIKQEMKRLIEEQVHSHLERLASLQAYLIYAILLLLCGNMTSAQSEILVELQEFTADVANSGVLCEAEVSQTRPDWESWILGSSKRRTIFAAYMFDNVVSFTTGLPSVVATELATLPAPGSKILWEASNRDTWSKEYNRHLARWEDGELLIGELRHLPGYDKAIQQDRIRRWLADVDDFGMMHFAVTTMIYGAA